MNFTIPEIGKNEEELIIKYKWFSQKKFHMIIFGFIVFVLSLIGPLTIEDCPFWFRMLNGLLFLFVLRSFYFVISHSLNKSIIQISGNYIKVRASLFPWFETFFKIKIDKIEAVYLSHFKDNATRTIHGYKEDLKTYNCEFLHDNYIYFLLKNKDIVKMKVFNEEQGFQPYLAGLIVDYIWNKDEFDMDFYLK